MLAATSRLRSPSTFMLESMNVRSFATSSSVRSRTRVSRDSPVWSQTVWADERPMPKMYVSEISSRFSRGMSTPAMRAIPIASVAAAQDTCAAAVRSDAKFVPGASVRPLLSLALLVTRVLADDAHRPVPAYHLALLTDLLDRRTDLHPLPCYLYRYVMRPRLRSYGVSSTWTRSPGRIRM